MKNKSFCNILRLPLALFDYCRRHIWTQLLLSVLALSCVLLVIFQAYLQNLYYRNTVSTETVSEGSVLAASANSMNYIISNDLKIGGEIAVNNDLYEAVHDTIYDGTGSRILNLRNLKNVLAGIAGYSENIAAISIVSEDGLIYEYGKYWIGNDSVQLWSGENETILTNMFTLLSTKLKKDKPGYYHVSTEPLWREDLPRMNVYHIAFPLLGGNHTFSKVEAAVVVTYKMQSIVRSAALTSDQKQRNSSRYLTDSNGKIIFHENENYIGMLEEEYLASGNISAQSLPLGYFGWKACTATDLTGIRDSVEQIYRQGGLIYLAVLVLTCLIWGILIRSILRPISTIKHSMRASEQGKREKIRISGKHEIWRLADEYNTMLDALEDQRQLTAKEYSEKMRMSELRVEAEKTALESQLNAHFIFNTLNAINYSVMETGNTELMRTVQMFADILRYTFRKDKTVTLGDEFTMAEDYLFLQKYRLMDKFEYELLFPQEYAEWPCCKLFLQPFIENSIVHGFAGIETGGRISISGKEEAGRFRVEISDNGCGIREDILTGIRESIDATKPLSVSGTGIGIQNALMRLKMFYGRNLTVTVKSLEGEGTEFVFLLPIPEEL